MLNGEIVGVFDTEAVCAAEVLSEAAGAFESDRDSVFESVAAGVPVGVNVMLGERVAEVPKEGGLVTDPTAEPVTLLDFDGERDVDVVAVAALD